MTLRISVAQCAAFSVQAPPLGLATIVAWLRRLGHEVKAYDFNGELYLLSPESHALAEYLSSNSDLRRTFIASLTSDRALDYCWDSLSSFPWSGHLLQSCRQAAARLLSSDPEVIGLSVQYSSLGLSLAIARAIREAAGTRPRLIFGGPECREEHVIATWLRSGLVDAVVVGEGEQPLAALLDHDPSGDMAIGRMRQPVVLSHQDFPALSMDHLPTPDFSDMNLDCYAQQYLPIMTSRGCVGRCTFCTEKELWRGFRQRDPSRVVADMRLLSQQTGRRSFRLNDSLINGRLDWLRQFCDLMRDSDPPLRWFGNARVHPRMTIEFLSHLREAGCAGLMFGVESAATAVLRRLRKDITAAQASQVITDCSRVGIQAHTYWMFGCPGEGTDEVLQSLRFIVDHAHTVDSVFLHRYIPLGTDATAGVKWGAHQLQLNLPIFRQIFFEVQGRMGARYDLLPKEPTVASDNQIQTIRRIRLTHPCRRQAIVLLSVIAAGLERLERLAWYIVRPHPSFMEQTNLAGRSVLVLLSRQDERSSRFVEWLCLQNPRRVCFHWTADWAEKGEEWLCELGTICDKYGIPWTRNSPASCPYPEQDHDWQQCEVCPALMYASPEETDRCCRAASDSLGIGTSEASDIWGRRQDLHDVFMEHFCALRRSRRCSDCHQQYDRRDVCMGSCSWDDSRLLESESIYDAWYS